MTVLCTEHVSEFRQLRKCVLCDGICRMSSPYFSAGIVARCHQVFLLEDLCLICSRYTRFLSRDVMHFVAFLGRTLRQFSIVDSYTLYIWRYMTLGGVWNWFLKLRNLYETKILLNFITIFTGKRVGVDSFCFSSFCGYRFYLNVLSEFQLQNLYPQL